MLSALLLCLVLFPVTLLGLAWPLLARSRLAPAEKIPASIAVSLLGIFVFGWGVFLGGFSPTVLWILPGLATVGLLFRREALATLAHDAEARTLIGGQLLLSAWCVGWQISVVSYSGGGWAADWFEHWERSQFFFHHWPTDFLFVGRYPLTARPPLANLVTAVFLQLTGDNFAQYQLISTLLGSLAFLPAALLARRLGGGPRVAYLVALLLMLNPLVVQNATFPWTKLPTVFFVLLGFYFFLRSRDAGAPPAIPALMAACLAGAVITHYSSGPYVVVLAALWLVQGWELRRERTWRRNTALAVATGALVLASWFGWTLATYGVRGTLLSNSSVSALKMEQGSWVVKIALNLRDTLVPHFLRPLDTALIAQTSFWGGIRDWFFQLYQLNLFFAFGSVAWLAILVALAGAWRGAPRPARTQWLGAGLVAVALGVGVHGARDTWGLTHICLQPLIVFGLVFLAAKWNVLGARARALVVAGSIFDFAAGILLHFSVQHQSPPVLGMTQGAAAEFLTAYNGSTAMNYAAKLHHQLKFLNDVFTPTPILVLALLMGLLIFALTLARAPTRPAS